jgi:hypothetical protein
MARLDEKIFETKKIVEGLVVVEYVVIGSQTAVSSLSSNMRYLAVGCWGQWVMTQHPRPSRNMQEGVERLV